MNRWESALLVGAMASVLISCKGKQSSDKPPGDISAIDIHISKSEVGTPSLPLHAKLIANFKYCQASNRDAHDLIVIGVRDNGVNHRYNEQLALILQPKCDPVFTINASTIHAINDKQELRPFNLDIKQGDEIDLSIESTQSGVWDVKLADSRTHSYTTNSYNLPDFNPAEPFSNPAPIID